MDNKLVTMKTGRAKAIISVPGWVAGMGQGSERVGSTAAAYSMVPLVYRALRLRCDSLASVPVRIMRGEQETAWPYTQPLTDLIWQTEAALLLAGAAYWEKVANKVAVKGVQWLNPFTMEVKLAKGEDGLPALEFRQNDIGGAIWTQDQIVYFKEFNPQDDIQPGVSASDAALADAQVMRYVTRFAGKYFEGGAMPITLLGFEGNVQDDELKRTETFFQRLKAGIASTSPWKVLAVRNNVKPVQLTPPLGELAMSELMDEARQNVALAFGIPQTMLADAANYATAKEHRLSFWQDTVQPRGNKIGSIINRQLLEAQGLELVFDFEEMDIFQEDEAERADSLNKLTASGVPLRTALEVLGYELDDEQWAAIDAADVADVQLVPEGGTYNANDTSGDVNAEMTRWQKMATKRLVNGQKPRAFNSDVISPAMLGVVQAQLEDCKTEAEIKGVFDHANVWGVYP